MSSCSFLTGVFACDQELNDKKRAATSGANFARAYTVQFGSCKFPYNFTGCQDLAKQKVTLLFNSPWPDELLSSG